MKLLVHQPAFWMPIDCAFWIEDGQLQSFAPVDTASSRLALHVVLQKNPAQAWTDWWMVLSDQMPYPANWEVYDIKDGQDVTRFVRMVIRRQEQEA